MDILGSPVADAAVLAEQLVLPNDAMMDAGSVSLRITTPAPPWACAASMLFAAGADRDAGLGPAVDLEVSQREVGVGVLEAGGAAFVIEDAVGEEDGRAALDEHPRKAKR